MTHKIEPKQLNGSSQKSPKQIVRSATMLLMPKSKVCVTKSFQRDDVRRTCNQKQSKHLESSRRN